MAFIWGGGAGGGQIREQIQARQKVENAGQPDQRTENQVCAGPVPLQPGQKE